MRTVNVENREKATLMPMRVLIPFVLMTFLPLLPAQKLGEVEKRQPTADAPRELALEWTSAEGRAYWYRLPSKAKASKNLLIMLHGTGLNHGWAFWNYGVAGGSFRPDDIIISPDGLTPGSGSTFNFDQRNKADGEQIAGLIRTFKKEFEIERVYIYGHSQGAFFSYWFQAAYPELVDGVIAHAGNLLGGYPHSKLSKEKVAIAILHGRADAVVPVSCAFATEKALKELGYQKLKLEIVENLTAQSGHWPLPGSVRKLLDWLDKSCAQSADSAVAALEAALASEKPELADLIDFRARAEDFVKKERGDEKKALEERFEKANAELEKRLLGLIEVLATVDAKAKEDSEDAALFRISALWLQEHPVARKELRSQFSALKSQEKEIEKCLALLSRKQNDKSLSAAEKVLGRNFLSHSRLELARYVESLLASPPDDLEAETRTELEALLASITTLQKGQDERLAKLLRAESAAASQD